MKTCLETRPGDEKTTPTMETVSVRACYHDQRNPQPCKVEAA